MGFVKVSGNIHLMVPPSILFSVFLRIYALLCGCTEFNINLRIKIYMWCNATAVDTDF